MTSHGMSHFRKKLMTHFRHIVFQISVGQLTIYLFVIAVKTKRLQMYRIDIDLIAIDIDLPSCKLRGSGRLFLDFYRRNRITAQNCHTVAIETAVGINRL